MAAGILSSVKTASSNLLRQCLNRTVLSESVRCASYDPYPKFEAQTPYKPKKCNKYGYHNKLYDGGILPRPKGKYEDEPLPLPKYDAAKRDQWTEKKALFGQNDYIDIFADGAVRPVDLMKGPVWLRGFKGHEFQRILRQLKFEGAMLKEMYPTRYHNMTKRLFFLYKRLNEKRRHAPFWGGPRRAASSRIEKLTDW
ncbi:hypothetical protein NP493_80g03047 [Ridgeia piscesae]|uniref:Large ribosomal subunit protein mL51 n=1 Tax=Ridgeia piscesae TaxID=27915 RepID=A0AAD9P939_RIDPI|nr:hypothetical protein NP493_80g03047 [Ridgeia piscesae]